VGFASVEENNQWYVDKEFQFELWSDTNKELALFYGAVESSSQGYPNRVTKILDDEGNLLVTYDDANFATNPFNVLEDCQYLFGQNE
jgi:peroxiredoxin